MMHEQRFLPLVSPRSPSYARARSELAHSTSSEAVSVAGLNRLVEAENDARRVCQQITAETQESSLHDLAVHLASIHADRQRLVGDLVRWLGGTPPDPEDSRATLQYGPDYFAGISVPTEVMAALRKMYAEIRSEYLRQATELELSSGIRHALHDLCPSPDDIDADAADGGKPAM